MFCLGVMTIMMTSSIHHTNPSFVTIFLIWRENMGGSGGGKVVVKYTKLIQLICKDFQNESRDRHEIGIKGRKRSPENWSLWQSS